MQPYRRMPAEWEHQEGILLCFPHSGADWPGKYQAVQWAFVEFIKKVATREKVYLVVRDSMLCDRVSEKLDKADVDLSRIHYIEKATNRSWMRDSGPIIVQQDGQPAAVQFHFNAWAKYSNYRLDQKIPVTIAEHLDLPLIKAEFNGKPVVLEGGAIDVNGKGTLITSEECLLDQSIQVRNPGLSKSDYENIFREYLGVSNTIWLKDGIKGDDTHGHIDDLARFVNPTTIVTVVESNPKDVNYAVLRENLSILQQSRLENGQHPEIVELPMPEPLYFEKIRIPASYANFLIINEAVLVPTFNDPNDRIALNTLADCFPDREIIGISAIDLIWGFGTLHCLSQQIPA